MTTIDPRIVGTWTLIGTMGVDDNGHALPPPYGPIPNGVVCFQADGRMYCVLCDGRGELPAGAPRQFMSYAGNYTFDGTTLSTRVDASSDASRVGGASLDAMADFDGWNTFHTWPQASLE